MPLVRNLWCCLYGIWDNIHVIPCALFGSISRYLHASVCRFEDNTFHRLRNAKHNAHIWPVNQFVLECICSWHGAAHSRLPCDTRHIQRLARAWRTIVQRRPREPTTRRKDVKHTDILMIWENHRWSPIIETSILQLPISKNSTAETTHSLARSLALSPKPERIFSRRLPSSFFFFILICSFCPCAVFVACIALQTQNTAFGGCMWFRINLLDKKILVVRARSVEHRPRFDNLSIFSASFPSFFVVNFFVSVCIRRFAFTTATTTTTTMMGSSVQVYTCCWWFNDPFFSSSCLRRNVFKIFISFLLFSLACPL